MNVTAPRSMLVGIVAGLAAGMVAFAGAALAQGNDLGVTNLASAAGAAAPDLPIIIARIIRAIFGILGIIALVLVLYGGFLWMTSGGDEEKIATAKRVLRNAAIGLGIMLAAFTITQFILSRLLEAGGISGPGGGRGAGAAGVPFSGALGAGIIESHYPGRGAVDVPRNTRVVITFKLPIVQSSFIKNWSPDLPSDRRFVEDANFKLFRDADGPGRALAGDRIRVGFTPDLKTYVFDPVEYLGSPSENIGYTVALTGGANGIKRTDGQPAFGGAFADGYRWDFIVGTTLDVTPPRVQSVVPVPDSRNPRNTLIEMTFSEPMDPTTVAGELPAFQNVSIRRAAPDASIPGVVNIGNGYRTIRFVSNDRCGTNACGGDVFCLPGATRISTLVRAATLSGQPPAADPGIVPADGATDMVGNSLDGNADGTATGPDTDSYRFAFDTTDEIDLTPPAIESVSPNLEEEQVAASRPIAITFTKQMSLVSFTSDAIRLESDPSRAPLCYNLLGENLNAAGEPAPPYRKSKAVVNHCLFQPETNYIPSVTEAVEDLHQNCYYPAAASIPAADCSRAELDRLGASFCCSGAPCADACVVRGGRPECPAR